MYERNKNNERDPVAPDLSHLIAKSLIGGGAGELHPWSKKVTTKASTSVSRLLIFAQAVPTGRHRTIATSGKCPLRLRIAA